MEKRYADFIQSVCNGTKSQKINWNYLDEDHKAIEMFKTKGILSLTVDFSNSFAYLGENYNKSNCFSTWLNDNALIFLRSNTGKMMLVLAAGGTLRSAIHLSDKDYAENLVALLALIRKQFPDPEDVVNQVISQFLNPKK